MKRALLILGLSVALALAGCEDDTTTVVTPEELSPPLGLRSITGDGEVTLFWWCSNYDDLDGFKIYMRTGAQQDLDPRESIPSGFEVVDSLAASPPCGDQMDRTVAGLTNGTTYSFLVVAAKDDWTDISQTSNIVVDTPRPESAELLIIYAKQEDAEQAGLELSDFSIVDVTGIDAAYDTPSGLGDVMCERFNPGAGARAWLDGINSGVIQDIGYMSDWNDADQAPSDGYADTGHSVEALMGHVYAVRTGDNHYAKLQVVDIDVGFSWLAVKAAYQTQPGQREYKR